MSVTEKLVSINALEREIFQRVCKLGAELFKVALETYDADLAKCRNRKAYRHKGKRRRTLKTVMGEVEYERTMYETVTNDGQKCTVYLLDEALGLQGSGFFSGALTEQIVRAACESSFRSTSRQISQLTGQRISHTGAWHVVQAVGAQLGVQEKQAANRAYAQKSTGRLERKLLFEEQDGIYLKLQGKSRKKHKQGAEMKFMIAYDGAKKVGSNRYELTNKVACASFESAQKFRRRKEGQIAAVYNVDEIQTRVLGGDGAPWIRQGAVGDEVHFQLDVFHRNRAVLQHVADPESQDLILKLLYSGDIDRCLEVIEAYANSTLDEVEQENFIQLHTYFSNNKDGLVPYQRRGLSLPKPPDGKMYRRLGAIESNIFTILGNRMKGRRACWSICGAENLARVLTRKYTGKLSEALEKLDKSTLPERYTEEVLSEISADQIPKTVGTGYNGFTRGNIPEYQWAKRLTAYKPLSAM